MSLRSIALAALCLLAVPAAGCGDDDPGAAGGPPDATAVTIRFDPDGAEGPDTPLEREVRCPSDGEDELCRQLEQLPGDVLAPVPDGVACTSIYGGPEAGRITGTIAGERVDARFDRRNGCEDRRFKAVERILRSAA